jgi:hypothetical protein
MVSSGSGFRFTHYIYKHYVIFYQSSIDVVVSFIGDENRNTAEKTTNLQQSLTNFIT